MTNAIDDQLEAVSNGRAAAADGQEAASNGDAARHGHDSSTSAHERTRSHPELLSDDASNGTFARVGEPQAWRCECRRA